MKTEQTYKGVTIAYDKPWWTATLNGTGLIAGTLVGVKRMIDKRVS